MRHSRIRPRSPPMRHAHTAGFWHPPSPRVNKKSRRWDKKRRDSQSLAFQGLTIITTFSLQTLNLALIAFNRGFKVVAFIRIERLTKLLTIMAVVALKFIDLTIERKTVIMRIIMPRATMMMRRRRRRKRRRFHMMRRRRRRRRKRRWMHMMRHWRRWRRKRRWTAIRLTTTLLA